MLQQVCRTLRSGGATTARHAILPRGLTHGPERRARCRLFRAVPAAARACVGRAPALTQAFASSLHRAISQRPSTSSSTRAAPCTQPRRRSPRTTSRGTKKSWRLSSAHLQRRANVVSGSRGALLQRRRTRPLRRARLLARRPRKTMQSGRHLRRRRPTHIALRTATAASIHLP